MYPSEFLNAADLGDKEVKAVIEKVVIEDVPDPKGDKKKKPVVYFKNGKKRLPLPKTCARVIAAKFGRDTDAWIGKPVVLYATTCLAFGAEVECVRIKCE
jgi:hypothetical protein